MNKKKTLIPIVIWEAVYPVLLYYALMLIASQILSYLLNWLNPENVFNLRGNYSFIQMFGAIITIPFIYYLYCNDRNGNQGMRAYWKENKISIGEFHIRNSIMSAVIVICFGFAMNNILYMTPLVDISVSFQSATEALYSGGLVWELICSAIFIPVLEELVFRGLVLARMVKRVPKVWALVISSVMFAVMHYNPVQFLYALVLGFVLGLIAIKTKHIYASIIGHMAVNCFAVLRSELAWFEDLTDKSVSSWLIAVGVLLIGLGLLQFYLQSRHFQRTE